MPKKIFCASLVILHILTQSGGAVEFQPVVQPVAVHPLQFSSNILKNENPLSVFKPFSFFNISDSFVNHPAPSGAGFRISSRETANEMLSSPSGWGLTNAYMRALSEDLMREEPPRRPFILTKGRLGVVDHILTMKDKSPKKGDSEIYLFDWLKEGQQGGVARTYDNNGNLTGDAGNTYGYDAENRLTTFSKTGTTASYTYDAFNRRVSKAVNGTVTVYIYDGANIIEERNSAGLLVADYVHGDRLDEPLTMTRGGTTYYYIADGLGSIRQLTNTPGAVQQTYDYDSYGKLSAMPDVVNPFTFTGREYDIESGNYYYRARYYSPTLGRFMQRDPSGFNGGQINLYEYVYNNPTNYVDPSGLKTIQECGEEYAACYQACDAINCGAPKETKQECFHDCYIDFRECEKDAEDGLNPPPSSDPFPSKLPPQIKPPFNNPPIILPSGILGKIPVFNNVRIKAANPIIKGAFNG